MTKRFVISTAVNDTNRHKGFFASIQQYARENDAQILIMAALYRNPTAKRGKDKQAKDQMYDAELVPFLTRKDVKLGKNITLFGSVPIQPTAGNALTGLEVYAAGSSGIIGHVKRQMTVIPTDTRNPRVLWTTGACTLPKYSRSRAGVRAKKHHVIGALIVEVEPNGHFFVRNVTGNADGSFTDLDRVYCATGSCEAPRALSVVLGDIHVGSEDEQSLAGARALVDDVQPKHLVLHDVLDFDSRSHHRRTPRDAWDRRFATVESEVSAAVSALAGFQKWGEHKLHVVRSNHDTHLTRWLNEHETDDIVNNPYWHALWTRVYEYRADKGQWPNEFELEANRLGLRDVNFLDREGSLRIGNVQHGFHGDKGVGGSRGTLKGYTKLGVKVTIGHSHTPGILDGCFQTGLTATKNMSYNEKPSTWLHAHVVLGADGKRQMVVVVDGRHRAN